MRRGASRAASALRTAVPSREQAESVVYAHVGHPLQPVVVSDVSTCFENYGSLSGIG